MNAAQEFLNDEKEVLVFLRSRFPMYHLSNFFFRDVQFGLRAFCEAKQGKKISYSDSETLARDFVGKLEKKKISAEVLDLRTLVPLDREAVVASARKTGRLLVVDEDYRSFGLSGEIAATVAEAGVALKSYRRLAVPDVPIPYSRPLEQFAFPSAEKIAKAAEAMVA